jgi:hypothetical protein
MFNTNDQLSKVSLSGFEAALRVAQISLDSAERLVKLNWKLPSKPWKKTSRLPRLWPAPLMPRKP